jgi:putative flippase GtrA
LTPLALVERNLVTATLLLRRRSAPAQVVGEQSLDPASASDGAADGADAPLSTWLRSDETLAQFARFVLVGASTTVVYASLFLGLGILGGLDYMSAHVGAIVVSTVLANEMHRRLTFHAEERVGWFAAQWEAGGVTALGLVATSTALRWLDAATDTADYAVQVTVVVAVTALIGALRFVALRWIFRSRPAGRA